MTARRGASTQPERGGFGRLPRGAEKIFGRHPVEEVLRAGRRKIHRLLAVGTPPPSLVMAAGRAGAQIEPVERKVLDSEADQHQGLAIVVGGYPYVTFQRILRGVEHAGDRALILLLDLVQDPQNLGAVLRTAEAVGVQGVLLPKRGAAGVTPAVVSASAGACEHVYITRTNLAAAMRQLKRQGVWIAGLENSTTATDIYEADLSTPLALAVGSEGRGLRRLVRDSCDYLVRLPMRGRVGSLNAAVAGSIVLYLVRKSTGGVAPDPDSEEGTG